jgi:methylamine dehydrogenase accessory protein MauD
MTEVLVVSNILLWLLVVVLAGLVLALMRQIGALHERVAPAGALVGRAGPRVGERAPLVEAADWHGSRRRIGEASADGASTLLFFTSPTCPVCKTLLPLLGSVARAEGDGLRVIVASDGPREEHEDFVREHRLDRGIYVLSAELGLTYQVSQLPYAVLLDAEGIVRAKGLVNTREHFESLFEARDHGVASVQEYVASQRDRQRVA